MLAQFFFGFSVFQLLLTTYQYIIFKRAEYVYYLIYVFLGLLLVLALQFPESNPFSILVTPKVPYILARAHIAFVYLSYIQFGRLYLNLKNQYPKFDLHMRITMAIIVFCAGLDIVLLSLGYDFLSTNLLYHFFESALAITVVYIVWFLYSRRQKLFTLLATGILILAFFVSIELFKALYYGDHSIAGADNLNNLIIGFIGEYIFLTYALMYKSKITEQQKYELQSLSDFVLFDEKNNLSNELKFDILAPTIHLQTLFDDININSNTNNDPQHQNEIRLNLHLLSRNIEDYIWSLRPQLMENLAEKINDILSEKNHAAVIDINSLANLAIHSILHKKIIVQYTRHFSNQAPQPSNVHIKVFLANNAIQIAFELVCDAETLLAIDISDTKLLLLVQSINGTYSINTLPNGRTQILLSLPMANFSYVT